MALMRMRSHDSWAPVSPTAAAVGERDQPVAAADVQGRRTLAQAVTVDDPVPYGCQVVKGAVEELRVAAVAASRQPGRPPIFLSLGHRLPPPGR